MLKVYAPLLISDLADMKSVAMSFTLITNDSERNASRTQMIEVAARLKGHLDEVAMSDVLRGQLDRLITAANVGPGNYDTRGVHVMSRELYINIIDELQASLFLMVPSDRRELYEQTVPPFGQAVAEKYPAADRDIRAAARCLALDEWTACVFHLMRVVEIGPRDMARSLRVPMSADIDYLQWAEIIDQINKAANKMGQGKRTPERIERQKFYAQAAQTFDHFKNAWRIHVSHSREHYDERDAVAIWNNVMTFVQVLAGGHA